MLFRRVLFGVSTRIVFVSILDILTIDVVTSFEVSEILLPSFRSYSLLLSS